jgi:hypothetical protein
MRRQLPQTQHSHPATAARRATAAHELCPNVHQCLQSLPGPLHKWQSTTGLVPAGTYCPAQGRMWLCSLVVIAASNYATAAACQTEHAR